MPKIAKLVFLSSILLIACSPLTIAHAQGNSGNGNGGGNSGNENSGGGQSESSGESGKDHGSNDTNGNGGGNAVHNDIGDHSKKSDEVAPSSTQAAPAVAQEGKTVKLETIYNSVHAASAGEIIDAQLVTVRGVLLYEIKLLQDDGLVLNVYYYARTGRPVTSR